MTCTDFKTLTAYWLGELAASAEAQVEEHLFGCAHCTRRLEELAGLAAGIRSAVQAGLVGAVVSAAFVEGMKAGGMRVREYRVAPGERVSCTIRADDDAVVTRIEAPLAGVKRVDLERIDALGGAERATRIADIPFDAASGSVHWLPSASRVRAMPSTTLTLRLLAVDEAGERPLGEYTLEHSAQAG